MLKAAIFDLDGVLVNTAKFHFLAWKRLASEKFKYNLTIEQNELFKGVNRIRCMEIMNDLVDGRLTRDKVMEYADIKNEWYKEYISNMTENDILDGALDFVKSCKRRDLYTCIASASKNTDMVLECTGIKYLFDYVVDGNCVTKAKPDPEVFLTAARMVGVLPDESVVFEDAQAGIDGAKAAHMMCIAIGSNKSLKGADRYVCGLNELKIEELL